MPSATTPPTDLRDSPPLLRALADWFDVRDAAHGTVEIDPDHPINRSTEHIFCPGCDHMARLDAAVPTDATAVQRDLRAWAEEIEHRASPRELAKTIAFVAAVIAAYFVVGVAVGAWLWG